ncbi:MAG TPA: hypothetical protein VH950_12205 [Gaiellaceae bacterium]
MLAALWLLADAAEEGAKIVISMLVTGLVFVAVILLGDWIHHLGLKRKASKTRTL